MSVPQSLLNEFAKKRKLPGSKVSTKGKHSTSRTEVTTEYTLAERLRHIENKIGGNTNG